MRNQQVHVCDTDEQAIEIITNWKQQGYTDDDILVMAHEKQEASSIEKATDVDAKANFTRRRESGGMIDDTITALRGNQVGYYARDEVESRLLQVGVAESDVQTFTNQFDSGKILVMITDKS
ncbi:general stress protein [Aneurinibacillus sp. REN35]|uniref:general stress protein n=1 Tax=Aneurinibacillus sp. REN35 TaxID=3237286 RepID=UPI0035291099